MATTVLDELLVGLGFDYDNGELGKFKKDLDKTVSSVKSFVKVAAAGAAALGALIVSSTRATDQLGKLSDEIGIDVSILDAYGFALGIAGGNADSMGESLRQLAIRTSEAARGAGSGLEAFALLGINAASYVNDTDGLIRRISGAIQGLDKQKQIELADKLGLKDSIRLLQLGPKAIEEYLKQARELGTVTKEDTVLAAEFQDRLTEMWRIFGDISRTLTRDFLPAINDIGKEFITWWKANREVINQKLPEWIQKAKSALVLFSTIWGVIIGYRLVAVIGGIVTAVNTLRLALIGASIASLPLSIVPLLWTSLILAAVLIVEDLWQAFTGGESVLKDIGGWILDGIGGAVKFVVGWFISMWEIVENVFKGVKKLFGLINSFNPLGKIADFFSVGEPEEQPDSEQTPTDPSSGIFTSNPRASINNVLNKGGNVLGIPKALITPNTSSQSIDNLRKGNAVITNSSNVNINGVSLTLTGDNINAKKIMEELTKISEQHQQTNLDLQTPVLA